MGWPPGFRTRDTQKDKLYAINNVKNLRGSSQNLRTNDVALAGYLTRKPLDGASNLINLTIVNRQYYIYFYCATVIYLKQTTPVLHV